MTIQVTGIEVQPNYKLHVKFNDSRAKLFDMKPYLNKGVFKELKNETYLKKIRIISGGVEWPHEQDLSADTLYYRGTSI